jgi:hypothetical protein
LLFLERGLRLDLPKQHFHKGDAMTRVVIVGEIYNADLSIGGGPIPPSPGSPAHPWVPPGAVPPGYWGGVAPPYPDQGLPGLPPGMPTHPIELPEPLPPPPAEIADKYVAAVWNPTTDTWKVSVSDSAPAPSA